MFIGQGIVLPHSSIRVSILSVPAPTVSILGLTDNPTFGSTLQIGQEATYTLAVSSGTITAWSWGQQIATGGDNGTTEEYGNGPNPTDLSLADGDVAIGGVLVEGDWYYTQPVPVRQAPPVPGLLSLPDIVEGAAPVVMEIPGAIEGAGVILSLVAPPAGVILAGSTLQIDPALFSAQSGVTLTIRGSNTGGMAEISADFDVLPSDITATQSPMAGDGLYETQSFEDLVDFAVFTSAGNYTSASGVTGVTVQCTRNGSAAVATEMLLEGDAWQIDFVVAQNAGADRVFSVSGICGYLFIATALPDGNLSLQINPIVPGSETIDLDINATSYSDLSIAAIRSGPFHAGGSAISFAGPVADLAAGDELSAEVGDWLTATGLLSFSYQWARDGVEIPGATGSTHVLGLSDPGSTISLTITGDDGATTSSVTAPPLGLPVGNTAPEFDRIGRMTRDNDNALTHTLNDMDLGAVDPARVIYVVVARIFEASSVVVGGVAATAVTGVDNAAGSGFNASVGIWKAAVPTGETADVVITGTTASIVVSADIYRTVGLVERTGTTSIVSPADLSLNTEIGDHVLGAMSISNGTQVTWTGLTEDFESDIRSGEFFSVASVRDVAAETPRSITATPDTNGLGHAAVAITLEAIA